MNQETEWDDFLREALLIHDIELVREALLRGANPNTDISPYAGTIYGRSKPLYWAAFTGRLDEAKALLEAGAKVACENIPEAQPLHAAVEDNNLPMVELFLEADGTAALNWFDDINRTPLMCAVASNNLQIARRLIAAGADVNAHDEKRSGDTALREAVERGLYEMSELLIDAGADPTIKGFMWITPLTAAQQREKPEGRRIAALLEKTVQTTRSRT